MLLKAIVVAEFIVIIGIGVMGFGVLPNLATKEWVARNPPILQLAPQLPATVQGNSQGIRDLHIEMQDKLQKLDERLQRIENAILHGG